MMKRLSLFLSVIGGLLLLGLKPQIVNAAKKYPLKLGIRLIFTMNSMDQL